MSCPSNPLASKVFLAINRRPATMSQVLCSDPNEQQTFDRKEEQNSGTCEEPLSLPAEGGYGYYPSAMVGHRMGQYKIVSKACVSISAGWHGD